MKLTTKSIEAFLRQPKQVRGALIYGPDEGQVRDRMHAIVAALGVDKRDPFGYAEFEYDALKQDLARLADECAAINLMGGQRAIIVRGAEDKLAATIAEILPSLHADAYLLCTAAELTPRSALRALFEKEALLAALPCYLDEGRELQAVLRAECARQGLRIAPDALFALEEALGNDRAISKSEIEKLALYAGKDTEVTLAHVQVVIAGNQPTQLDACIQALMASDTPQLKRALDALWKEGVQPIMLIRSALRHAQRLLQVQMSIQSGASPDEAIAALKPAVFFKQLPSFKDQLRRWSLPRLYRLVEALDAMELGCKRCPVEPQLYTEQAMMKLSASFTGKKAA